LQTPLHALLYAPGLLQTPLPCFTICSRINSLYCYLTLCFQEFQDKKNKLKAFSFFPSQSLIASVSKINP
jgi:hypothetical protein